MGREYYGTGPPKPAQRTFVELCLEQGVLIGVSKKIGSLQLREGKGVSRRGTGGAGRSTFLDPRILVSDAWVGQKKEEKRGVIHHR